MAWRRSGAKPLSEPMMESLLTHICVAGPFNELIDGNSAFLFSRKMDLRKIGYSTHLKKDRLLRLTVFTKNRKRLETGN